MVLLEYTYAQSQYDMRDIIIVISVPGCLRWVLTKCNVHNVISSCCTYQPRYPQQTSEEWQEV